MKKKISTLEVFFTSIVVFSPILLLYGKSSVTFFDLFIALFYAIIFMKSLFKRKIIQFDKKLMVFLIYLIIQFLIFTWISYSFNQFIDVGLRTARYLILLLTIIVFKKKYFSSSFGIEILKYLCIFSVLYYFFQLTSVILLGIYPKGYIPGIPIIRENLVEHSSSSMNLEWFRPRSIFGELSQYSIVVSTYLILSMNSQRIKDKWYINLLLIMGLLFSSSSLGVMSVAMILGLKAMQVLHSKKNKILNFTLYITGLIVLIFYFLQSPSYTKFISRLGNSLWNRFGAYYDYFDLLKKVDVSDFLFGYGMTNQYFLTWNPSYTKMLVYFGFIGTLLFFFCMFLYFKYFKSRAGRIIILYFIFLGLSTEVFIGNFIVFFICIAEAIEKDEGIVL